MKCPLQRFTVRYKPGETKVEFTDCIKEKCAWWAPAWETCVVNVLVIRLTSFQDTLQALVKKMPTPPTIKRERK